MNDDAASRRRAGGRVVSAGEHSEHSRSRVLTQDEAEDLTEEQRRGFNCVVCGESWRDGPGWFRA